MTKIWPVAKAASSLASQTAVLAMSAGWPKRPAAWRARASCSAACGLLASAKAALAISVMIQPGAIALQRMPSAPWSTATERVRPCTNAFEAFYNASDGSAARPEIEPMLMIEPPPLADIPGMKARQQLKTPRASAPIS